MRVLFVDDDDVTLFLYKMLVKSTPDCTAFYAKDGSEALAILSSEDQKIDVIFLDINMPVMDGFELLKQHELLPETLKATELYVMLGTDIAEDKKQKLFHYTGVKNCIPKPLRLDNFSVIVEQIRA